MRNGSKLVKKIGNRIEEYEIIPQCRTIRTILSFFFLLLCLRMIIIIVIIMTNIIPQLDRGYCCCFAAVIIGLESEYCFGCFGRR